MGLLFDPLIFALLLKCMGLPVVIQSTFQIGAVLNTLFGLALAFALILLLNSFRLLRYSSLHLMQQKRQERRKDASCWSKLFRTRTLRNCFLFSANSRASSCGCPKILYCRYLGHSCDLSLIQRGHHYLFKISQRSEILLLQAREFYIRLQLNSTDAKKCSGPCDH